MRQRPCHNAPLQFAFWTRGEIARLGLMAITCTIPLIMPPDHARQLAAGALPAHAAMGSGGHVRAIRMTKLDLSAAGLAALGDRDGD